jgi:hypothetical protein
MVVDDNAESLITLRVFESIASRLAPTRSLTYSSSLIGNT